LGILYFILCGLFKYVVVSRDYAHAQQFIMETEERQLPLRTVLQHYELEEQILGAWCKQAGRDERLRRGFGMILRRFSFVHLVLSLPPR
jgi:hypothetical protein